MEDESRAVCVSMCLFVFVSVCFCIYLLLSVYVFIATCVIVRLHCVIREPGGCEGGREQSRGGEEHAFVCVCMFVYLLALLVLL